VAKTAWQQCSISVLHQIFDAMRLNITSDKIKLVIFNFNTVKMYSYNSPNVSLTERLIEVLEIVFSTLCFTVVLILETS